MDETDAGVAVAPVAQQDVLGADRDALATMLANDPKALMAVVQDILQQTTIEEWGEVNATLEPQKVPRGGIVSGLIAAITDADLLGAVVGNSGIGDLLGQLSRGITGDGPGPGSVARGTGAGGWDVADVSEDREAWLGWLERLLRPYNKTGAVHSVDAYAPIFDIQCHANAAKSIKTAAHYCEVDETKAELTFSCPGIAMDAKFDRTLTCDLTFDEVAGSHQLSLPVRLEVSEWLNAATGRRKFTARVVEVFGPTQFDAFSTHYCRPTVRYKKPYLIGGLTSLNKKISLERGMSASASVPIPILEGTSLTMSYQTSLKTALTVSLTGGGREYALSEGQDAPLFLSVARPE